MQENHYAKTLQTVGWRSRHRRRGRLFHQQFCRFTCQRPPSGGMQESLSAGTFGLKKINKVYTEKYPTTIMSFDKVRKGSLHPTQKPVALMEYLVKTYTLEGQTVLDFAMGSGTTGVACKNLGRDFIGIEKEKEFFEIAENRINNVLI